jgi:predicted metal-dependent peptidase
MQLRERISKSRVQLLFHHPFYGALAMGMQIQITKEIPTAATDGKRIMYNPDFCEGKSDPNMLFLTAHEVMHPALYHLLRRGNRDPYLWNVAGDVVINYILKKDNVGTFIEGGVDMPDIYEECEGNTDAIYNRIQQPDMKSRLPDKGTYMADLMEGDGMTESEMQEMEANIRVAVAHAAMTAKAAGKLSAHIERFVDQIMQPKVRWEDVLRNFVEKCRTDHRTFARPARRFASQGIYLPSVTGEATGELVFAIDCSGSITQDLLAQFKAEMDVVKQDFNPAVMHVVYFDSEVCHYDRFARDEELTVDMHGGGGTAFSPIFRFVEEQAIDPQAVIFLTDLCCSDFGPAPQYPVMWVSTMPGSAPFGEIVVM